LSRIQQFLAALIAVALFLAGLVFASVLFAVAAIVALIFWGWMWWRMRKLRRTVDSALRRGAIREGTTIIEGEYRVERESAKEVPPPKDRTPK